MRPVYDFLANTLEHYLRFDARYFLRGGFWLTLSQGITILFGIVTTALLAHYLSETNYGVYRYLIGIAALLSVFSLTGLGQSVLQTAAKKYYNFYLETLRTNFLYSLFITVFSLIGAGYYWFNENAILALGCVLIALVQPLINTFQLTPVFLLGSQRFKESTIAQTIKTVVVSVSTLTAVFLTQNVLWLFFAYLLSSALASYIIHRTYRPAPSALTPPEIKQKYVSYAKHTTARNIIAGISNRLDTIVVFTQLGAVELAVYSIATIIPEQIKGSFKSLGTLLIPKYAQHTDGAQFKKSVPKRSLQLFLILSVITVVYILIAPYVYQFLFPKYPDAVLYSQIASISFLFYIYFIPYSMLLTDVKESKLYNLLVSTSVIQVILVVGGIIIFGLIGAIVAKIIHRAIFTFFTFYLLSKKI